ncbi:ABC transporter permease [Spiroplasma helicoides]|uniref:ABC transporter permease n=1 Tax=Spiroplasma helicoides TaxID=216938 RepID=A0A1B3SKJ8_9MOLU|nr:ABC transporter permease [Spiroplasma helicoides]AOG60437.1 ABC transporter permease [Spiroplasma helicoides]
MLQIIKQEFIKYAKNPFGIVFGFGFPISWTIIYGMVWGKEDVQGSLLMNYLFPPLSIMAILSFSISSIPITMCANRIDKRIKIIALANITKLKYIFSLVATYYTMYFVEFMICLITAIAAFNLSTSATMISTLLFLPIPIFIVHFMMSVTMANFGKSINFITSMSFFILMISLFFSGATVPGLAIDTNDVWFKYFQYILPTGNAVLLMEYIANGLDTTQIWWVYVTSIIYTALFAFLAIKYFKWD